MSNSSGTKKKHPASPTSPTITARDPTEAGLQFIRSTLKSAPLEAKIARIGDVGEHLVELLSSIDEVVRLLVVHNLLTKKGKLRSPQQKRTKEMNSESVMDHTVQLKPTMVDASTDTLLNPRWWHVDPEDKTGDTNSAETKDTERPKRARKRKQPTAKPTTEPMEVEGAWHTVERRKPAIKTSTAHPKPKAPARPIKPPAVLVKVATGSTYADTVRAIRNTSGLTPESIGSRVTALKKTREGHLLVQLSKGQASQMTAEKIRSAIADKLGDQVGDVRRLGATAEVEIVDIDAAADQDEVLSALKGAIPGEDTSADSERDNIRVTGLWMTRSGQQVATATMAPSTAAKIQRVAIGWTMCRVRPRRQLPSRCYRCHGFGHVTANCPGPDLTSTCRRCGESGHQEKQCEAGNDRCVACERINAERISHRPGSGQCAALRAARQTTGDLSALQ
jgi:hypothetical protein